MLTDTLDKVKKQLQIIDDSLFKALDTKFGLNKTKLAREKNTFEALLNIVDLHYFDAAITDEEEKNFISSGADELKRYCYVIADNLIKAAQQANKTYIEDRGYRPTLNIVTDKEKGKQPADFIMEAKYYHFRLITYKKIKESKTPLGEKAGKEQTDEILELFKKREEIAHYFLTTIIYLIKVVYESYLKLAPDPKLTQEELLKEDPLLNAEKKESTIARQVIAMHFIYEYMKVKNVDQSVKAKFTEFLTGGNYKNIYDATRKPFLTKTGNVRTKDMQFVKELFEGLHPELAKMIGNEIDKPKSKQ